MRRAFHLLSPRLGFGLWEAADLPLAMALWGDAAVTRLIGGPFDAAAVAARLAAERASQAAAGIQYWPLFLREDGAHVGCAGLRPHRDPAVPELGFHLLPPFWGRGLAEDAARRAITHAFAERGCSALFAGHHPENAASRRLLLRLGFRETGVERYPPTGRDHPTYRLAAAEAR